MNDSTVYAGLDTHKDSNVAAYALGLGEVQNLGDIGVRECDVDRLGKRLQSQRGHVRCVYEAGPTGYALYRHLVKRGFEGMVCAPALIARKAGDGVKTDRRDAAMLVKALRMGDLTAVPVPDVLDEAIRDLVRAWGAAKLDLKRARQRPKSFLLVPAVRCAGTAKWGSAHRRWLSEFSFPQPWSQIACEEHRRAIDERLAQCERLEAALREAAPAWRFYPVGQASQALRGVQFTVAICLSAELGELSHPTPSAHPEARHLRSRGPDSRAFAKGWGSSPLTLLRENRYGHITPEFSGASRRRASAWTSKKRLPRRIDLAGHDGSHRQQRRKSPWQL